MPQNTAHGKAVNRGRKRPEQRDVDMNATRLGTDLNELQGLDERYQTTLNMEISDKCRKDYRNRIVQIVNYLKNKYPEYYKIGVQKKVALDVFNNPSCYYFKNKKFRTELKYQNLNENYILDFLIWKKIIKGGKSNGKYASVGHLRKFRDAIVWGAKIQNQRLPYEFHAMFDRFISAYTKEYAQATNEGKTDKNSCDPIPFTVYKLILKWAIETSNILVWFWTLSQWNCMARSANIDPLKFHNFSVGPDSIIVKYDDTKKDKDAVRLSQKKHFCQQKRLETMLLDRSFHLDSSSRGRTIQRQQKVVVVKEHGQRGCIF